jgi:hypothetical protein
MWHVKQGSFECPLIRYGIRKNIRDRKKVTTTHSLHHDSTRMKDRDLWRISLGCYFSISLVDFEFFFKEFEEM